MGSPSGSRWRGRGPPALPALPGCVTGSRQRADRLGREADKRERVWKSSTERGELKRRGAARGQHVVRARHVVADHLRACARPRNSAPACRTAGRSAQGSATDQLQVLGRDAVGEPHGGGEVRHDDHRPERSPPAPPWRAGAAARAAAPTSRRTARASAGDGVTQTAAAIGSCSAWASRSAATKWVGGRLVGHAPPPRSGPATMSMPTSP